MIPPRIQLVLALLSLPLAAAAAAPDASPAASAVAPASPTPDNTWAIRTPPAPATPRINGPRIYGERPGRPFLYHIPVTGQRPITITAEGLPDGLKLDSATGNITGAVAAEGENMVKVTASNALGSGTAALRIVIGPYICLTPPLGWNSWNGFRAGISDTRIRQQADAMVSSGLLDHGWTYVNMDDRWEGDRDASGAIQSGKKFPDMKALADYVHGLGLKIGLYSSPGPMTCAGAVGSYLHEDRDAATYAAWGIDYLKYDWCSYGSIAEFRREDRYADFLPPVSSDEAKALALEDEVLAVRKYGHDPAILPQTDALKKIEASTASMTRPEIAARLGEISARMKFIHSLAKLLAASKVAEWEVDLDKAPYLKMRLSLNKVNRDIVYSFCQYGRSNVWEWGAQAGGNLWRTTGDINDNWKSVESHGFNQNGLEKWAGPGHWNDPDMLEIGNGDLTPDEHYTHMTLWCMLSAPLLIGCDMTKMTPFVTSLFCNDEVIAVNQDALGKQGWRASQTGETEVWVKPLADGSMAVAFFNRGDSATDVSADWSDLKLSGAQMVRDLWRQKDMGAQATGYTVNVAAHGAELFRVTPRG